MASPLPTEDDSEEERHTVHFVSRGKLDQQFREANPGVELNKARQWRNSYYEFIRELGMKLNMYVLRANPFSERRADGGRSQQRLSHFPPLYSHASRPQLVIATGTVFCHKFYANCDIRKLENDRFVRAS